MFKKLLLAAVIGATFAGIAPAAFAQVTIRIAPPPPRQEAMPEPRRGMQWVPGHWEWRNRRHVWVGGHWMRERRGYAYEAPRWVERNGRWVMNRGQWVRATRNDRDGDGIRNRNDKDRDGDGVRNRNDSAPNNPNRN